MMPIQHTISIVNARRLNISAQRLAAPIAPVSADTIVDTVRSLGCVQIDAVRAVENTQLLVLWSRLGPFDPVLLDQLLYSDFRLFEYWAHAASIVATDDYPIHATRMRHHRQHTDDENSWLAANQALQTHILERLRADGPLPTAAFEDLATEPWSSSGWNDNRNVIDRDSRRNPRGLAPCVWLSHLSRRWHWSLKWQTGGLPADHAATQIA